MNLFCFAAIIPVLRWNKTGITVAGISGMPGNTSSQLNTPLDVTLDYLNTLYIADLGNARVQKYLRDASTGSTVAGNGAIGSSANQLSGPAAVLVDSNGNIYVVDTGNNRIQYWSNGATSGTTIAENTSVRKEKVHPRKNIKLKLKFYDNYICRCGWKHEQFII